MKEIISTSSHWATMCLQTRIRLGKPHACVCLWWECILGCYLVIYAPLRYLNVGHDEHEHKLIIFRALPQSLKYVNLKTQLNRWSNGNTAVNIGCQFSRSIVRVYYVIPNIYLCSCIVRHTWRTNDVFVLWMTARTIAYTYTHMN